MSRASRQKICEFQAYHYNILSLNHALINLKFSKNRTALKLKTDAIIVWIWKCEYLKCTDEAPRHTRPRSHGWLRVSSTPSYLLPFRNHQSNRILFSADECLKGAAYLPETLLDPKTTHSEELSDAAYARGLSFAPGTTVWDHYDSPAGSIGARRKERFASAMGGLNSVQPPESILSSKSAHLPDTYFLFCLFAFAFSCCLSLTSYNTGFDWSALPLGSLVVDVGGGYGHVSLQIAKQHAEHLRYVVEDRPTVIDQARVVSAFL